jgi:hypothetical protein
MTAPIAAVAQVVVYTDKRGHGKPRAAIVKATSGTYNQPVPDEGQLAVLQALDLNPPAPQRDPLDASRDEVILQVFGIQTDYSKRAIFDPSLGTFVATPPLPEPAPLADSGPETPFGAFDV